MSKNNINNDIKDNSPVIFFSINRGCNGIIYVASLTDLGIRIKSFKEFSISPSFDDNYSKLFIGSKSLFGQKYLFETDSDKIIGIEYLTCICKNDSNKTKKYNVKWSYKSVYFSECHKIEDSYEFIKRWRYLVQQTIDRNISCLHKNVFFIINPLSGTGNAIKTFNSLILPFLSSTNIKYEVFITKSKNDLLEMATNIDVTKYSSIVFCSGDGLLHEWLNGIFQRSNYKELLMKCPVYLIPFGSGNSLCHSILSSLNFKMTISNALYVFLKGSIVHLPLCLVKIVHDGVDIERLSFLSITTGFIALVDIKSEIFRSIGQLRFEMIGLYYLIKNVSFKCKLKIIPNDSQNNSRIFQLFDKMDRQILSNIFDKKSKNQTVIQLQHEMKKITEQSWLDIVSLVPQLTKTMVLNREFKLPIIKPTQNNNETSSKFPDYLHPRMFLLSVAKKINRWNLIKMITGKNHFQTVYNCSAVQMNFFNDKFFISIEK